MTPDIALSLAQDGLVNGAIYALLALALVLVFSVTRIIFIPQGEFVAFGGLTLAALQAGRVPGTLWLLCAVRAGLALADGIAALRAGSWRGLRWALASNLGYPVLMAVVLRLAPFASWPAWAQ